MPTPELRPPADHESADVRVVAPVNAGQQGGTYSQFRSWLFDELERLLVDVDGRYLGPDPGPVEKRLGAGATRGRADDQRKARARQDRVRLG